MQTLSLQSKSNAFLLFTLTLGVFAIISSSLGIMGLVPIIALKFDVSSTKASHIVSYFAFIVMLFAPLTPLICEKIKPKPLMLITLGLFCVSAFGSIFANSFELLLFFRLLPAFLHPVYIALALSLASHSSKDKKQSTRALSFVFMGMSMGMVLGVSIATFLGSHFSFEWAMGFFFALNLLCFCITFFIKPLKMAQSQNFKAQLSILKKPLLWISVLAVLVCVGAIYGFYSFLSDFLHNSAGFDFNFISLALFVYGLFSVLGNFLASKALISYEKATLFGVPLGMMGAYFLLFLSEKYGLLLILILALLGVLSGMANNLTQFLISNPFEKAKELTNGLYVSFSNLGISLGTLLCGLFINSFSLDLLTFVPILLLALLCMILLIRAYIQNKEV